MIKKYIGTGLVALGLLFSVGFAAPAQAASLTSAQVQAVISLLQSFGVDASTIANVQATLGGSSSGLSCSTFADITYGNFDTNPGGRVSQLQTWLGISSNTFGFGTYGPKTRALWNSRCGGGTNVSNNSLPLRIDNIIPSSGVVGSTVTLTGAGFGSASIVDVLENKGAGVYPTSVSPTQLTFIVSNELTPGTYHIRVVGSVAQTHGTAPTSNYVTFTVTGSTGSTSYTPVALKDVISYASTATNNYVSASGKVAGIITNSSGDSILLTDGNGNYILATVAHAFVSDFSKTVSQIGIGDTITVKGVAGLTSPHIQSSNTLENQFGLTVTLPDTIGMISISDIVLSANG